MGLLVEPIDAQDVWAGRISPFDSADTVEGLGRAAVLGYTGITKTCVQPNTSPPAVLWTLTLSKPGAKDQTAYAGDWLVCDSRNAWVLTNSAFIAEFTTDTPLEWNAGAPAVEALPADQVLLTFPQPTSPCGPFTYTATSEAGPLNIVDQSVVDGVVSLRGDGLITDQEYAFTVTVSTPYGGEQVSETSEPITAIL